MTRLIFIIAITFAASKVSDAQAVKLSALQSPDGSKILEQSIVIAADAKTL